MSIGCFLPGVAMPTQEIAELAQALTETRQELVRLHGVQAAAAAAIPVGGGSVDVETKVDSIIDARIINRLGSSAATMESGSSGVLSSSPRLGSLTWTRYC